VDSSPTCGVTGTYYGAEGTLPAKREGRGAFLSRFEEIPAVDVKEFSRYRVYLAAPLFSEAERNFNIQVARSLREHYFRVHLPQDIGDSSATREGDEHSRIFRVNLQALEESDIVVSIIDGADADSGTAWEMGYAMARGKRVVAVRTDFRMVGAYERVNLMLEQSATVVKGIDELIRALKNPRSAEQAER
jgi:nucleoside 2-deoxyribosyltransferase